MASWLSNEEPSYFSVLRAWKGSAWGRDRPPEADVRGVQAPGVGGPGKTPLIWAGFLSWALVWLSLAPHPTAACQVQPRAEPLAAVPSGFRLSCPELPWPGRPVE